MPVFAWIFLFILASCSTSKLRSSESARAALGKQLFFDPRLSHDNSISCASCHVPSRAFTNGQRVAVGVHGRRGDRNVPTLVNRAGSGAQFWDMRASSLENQVALVLSSEVEMGASSLEAIAAKVNADENYQRQFKDIFGEPATPRNMAVAIAAYERRLKAGEAAYDRFLAGDTRALSADQTRGKNLFFKKFRCDSCHSGPNFTDEKLRVRCYPVASGIPPREDGLKLKTPTLRNLVFTGPYMHNGSLDTLEQVVDFYSPSFQINADGKPDAKLPIVRVSARERRDLVAFLRSLSAKEPFQE